MPPSSLYCCHKSASMSSAAARNRRMSASPRVRPPRRSVAAVAFANRPAPMVPAPTASDVPKKERLLTERFGGLGFDADVVSNDAVYLLIGFIPVNSRPLALLSFAHSWDF